ncbi:MAG: hypothetical protein MUF04_12195 [Akkermansiaceae bacterium]|nr:hypothetical protein [Akkermansiaceae bacterium]
MRLAVRQSQIAAAAAPPLPVLEVRQLTTRLRSWQARLGAADPPDPDEGGKIQQRAALLEDIRNLRAECDALKLQRRATQEERQTAGWAGSSAAGGAGASKRSMTSSAV